MAKTSVQITKWDRYGNIAFSVNGQIQSFILDAMYFTGGFYRRLMDANPFKAYEFAIKLGKPKPELIFIDFGKDFDLTEEFQDNCPECGAHAESYQSGIVPCPNCDYCPNN